MAKMDAVFMQSVAAKTKEIYNMTGLSRKDFCDVLKIPGSYLSSLHNTSNWEKIPAWAWFLFQDLTNRKIELNSKGEIVHMHDSYTLEEIHEDCRRKGEEWIMKQRNPDGEMVRITKTNVVIPMSDKGTVGDIERNVSSQDMFVKKYAKNVVPNTPEENVTDFAIKFSTEYVDFMIKHKTSQLAELRKIKKDIEKWKKRKQ